MNILLDTITLAAAAAPGDSSLIGQFGIDIKLILAQAMNFVVVAFLLWRFAFKPVMETLDERQKKIIEGLQFAEESKRQLAKTEIRQAEVLREAQVKAQEILHQTRETARQFEDKMKAQTESRMEEARQRADEANKHERQKILTEVRQEIARLVVLTSGRVLQRELSPEEKSRLDKTAAEEISQLN